MLNNKLYDDNYRNALSEYFISLRNENRRTFEEVALALNLKPNTFYHYECGKRDMPISVFVDLCKYYGLNHVEVFEKINAEATARTQRTEGHANL